MAPLLESREGVDINVYGREHLPPHIHASHGDDEALVNIRTGEIFKGQIPKKKLRIVQEWLAEGENRQQTEKSFYELNPRLAPRLEEYKPRRKKKKHDGKGGKSSGT